MSRLTNAMVVFTVQQKNNVYTLCGEKNITANLKRTCITCILTAQTNRESLNEDSTSYKCDKYNKGK